LEVGHRMRGSSSDSISSDSETHVLQKTVPVKGITDSSHGVDSQESIYILEAAAGARIACGSDARSATALAALVQRQCLS
jgi:hypothetical protein